MREAGGYMHCHFRIAVLTRHIRTGLVERYHITRTEVGFDSCVVVSAKYSATGVVLNRQTLYPALHRIVLAHPALSVQVATGPKPNAKPRFVQLPEVNLDDVVAFAQERDYENSIAQVLMAQLDQTFELGTANPLWRLVVVSGRTVVFAYHHAIADGQSGLAFHAALLSILNSPSDTTTLSGNKVTIPEDSSLVPAVESLTSISVSFGGLLSAACGAFAPQALTKAASSWTGNPVTQTPSVKMHVRCWEIEASQAAELLTLCRKNGATLTGCMHTLAAGVLSRLISSNQDLRRKRFQTLCSSVPISLRRYTGASPYVLCDHVSSVRSYTSVKTLANESTSRAWFSWPVAAKFSKRIAASAKKSREVIGTMRILFMLGISKSYFLDQLGKKRHNSFELSNLGKFPAPPEEAGEGPWSIGSVYLAQCDSVTGSAIKLNVVGSPTGSINVTFSWGQGTIDDDLAETFIRDVKAALFSVLESTLLS